jgi:hypothetical protein
MAKQTGIFPIAGTIGGVNFYYRKGVPFARKAGGGFNGDAIKTKPSMERVRENSSEFGHCSTAKRVFKMALDPFLHEYKEGTLHGRMMKLFQEIKVCDTISMRGKRNLSVAMGTPMGQKLLQQFDFTPKQNVMRTLGNKGVFDWNTRTYTIADFDIRQVKFMKNASHLKLTLGILRFDFASLEYEMELGEPLLMDRGFAATGFVMDFSGAVETRHALSVQNGNKMVFLGLKFYKEIDGEMYLMKEGVGLGVL